MPPGADVLFVDVGGNMLSYGAVGDSVAFYNITDADGFGTVQLASAPTQATDSNSVQLMRAAFATITAPPYSVRFVNEVEVSPRTCTHLYAGVRVYRKPTRILPPSPLFGPKATLAYGAGSASRFSSFGFRDDCMAHLGSVLFVWGL